MAETSEIENEMKIVLRDDIGLEGQLRRGFPVQDIRQGYLAGNTATWTVGGKVDGGATTVVFSCRTTDCQVIYANAEVPERLVSILCGQSPVRVDVPIKQGGVRVRRTSFSSGGQTDVLTFKLRLPNGSNLEINADLQPSQFDGLWSGCPRRLEKIRCKLSDAGVTPPLPWDVDFFKDDEGRTYFAMAEVEMPEDMSVYGRVHPALSPFVLWQVPRGDSRFSSYRLGDKTYALDLLAGMTHAPVC